MKTYVGIRFLFSVVLLSGMVGRLNAATFETLHDLISVGSNPRGRLTEGSVGNLYGTTELGGAYDGGTVFKFAKDGSNFAFLVKPIRGQSASRTL